MVTDVKRSGEFRNHGEPQFKENRAERREIKRRDCRIRIQRHPVTQHRERLRERADTASRGERHAETLGKPRELIRIHEFSRYEFREPRTLFRLLVHRAVRLMHPGVESREDSRPGGFPAEFLHRECFKVTRRDNRLLFCPGEPLRHAARDPKPGKGSRTRSEHHGVTV